MYSSEQQQRAQSVSNMFSAAGETQAQRTENSEWPLGLQTRMGWMDGESRR